MMKLKITALLLFVLVSSFSQTATEKFRHLEPSLSLKIWDQQNSSKSLKIDTLSYYQIPKHIDFKGTVVQALKWSDNLGDNILIQTVTGYFDYKDNNDDDESYHDKSELFAYLFQKKTNEKLYTKQWKVYDYTECYGVDWYTGFVPQGTTITDVDNNGISEITMPYVSICRGGMDPGILKIITYQGQTKYALRGETRIGCGRENPYGGSFKESDNLKANPKLKTFLFQHWDRNKCEEGKYY